MENFTFHIPTVIYFGKGQIEKLGPTISAYGSKVLVVYGGGSIKQNGIYEQVISALKENEFPYIELSGVEPNPTIETVRKGVQLCREHHVDLLLPVGGGSVIDCAKMISAGACYSGDPWDLVINSSKIQHAFPIITILTAAATGSQMDPAAVISNPDTHQKIGAKSPWLLPKVSFMDPTYTETVGPWQTACGVADIMSHTLENYFSNSHAFLQERVAEAILKTCIHYGLQAVQHPGDYEARANLMWASSWAINGFLKLGKMVNFSVHPIEHELSAYYGITHGAGLAILTPHWMRYVLDDTSVVQFQNYGINVWGISDQLDPYEIANLPIRKTEEYFRALGLPTSLREMEIGKEKFDEMAEHAATRMKGTYRQLSKQEIIELLNYAF